MKRVILTYSGKDMPPPEDVDRLHSISGLKILDTSLDRVFLVEIAENLLTELEMPGWSISEERKVPLPDSRRKVKSF
jgi:hypothetical protein